MALVHLFGLLLRLAELAFAAIVAGLTGAYLHSVHGSADEHGRFIYTVVVAGLAAFLALVWLVPFAASFAHYPADLLLSVCWFVAFGLLVDWLHGTCGSVFNWGGLAIDGGNRCPEWKANLAFCFLSAICWLASAVLSLYWVHWHGHEPATHAPVQRRRRWYRARV